jgi:hypothetical protein
LLLAFLGVTAAGSAQESSGFLLRHRVRLVSIELGIDATTEQAIFRDGLIVTTTETLSDVQISRRRATPEELRKLHAAFRQYRIGEERGACYQASTQFDFIQDTFTWFSRGAAGHTFKVGDPFTEICGANLTRLLAEISDFLGSATAEPGLQDVVIPN